MLRNFLFLALLHLAASPAFGIDGNIKGSTRTFFITFVDTGVHFKEVLHFDYNDTGKHKIVSITAPEDTVLKKDTVKLTDSLAFQDYKDQINKIVLKHNVGHTISENSLWEIYQWVLAQIYGNSQAPLSGRLHLASYVQYFDGGDNEEDDSKANAYRSRIKQTESLVDKENYATFRMSQLSEKKKALSDTLAKKALEKAAYSQEQDNFKKFEDESLKAVQKPTVSTPDILKDAQATLAKIEDYRKVNSTAFQANLNAIAVFVKNPKAVDTKFTDNYIKSIPTLQKPPKSNEFDSLLVLQKFLADNPKAADAEIAARIIALGGKDQLSNYVKTGLPNAYKAEITTLLAVARAQLEKSIGQKEINNSVEIKALAQDSASTSKQMAEARQNLTRNNIGIISNVQMQFERGFIENIKVIVMVDNIPTLFENKFAIGFTSKYNFAALGRIKLFARNFTNSNLHIWLADVLRMYDNELDNYTRDYSPADTTLSIDPNATPRVFLYKSQFVNLFEAKAYTDLAGLSNQQPNGILQIEVSRRLNINTIRHGRTSNVNYGFGNYLYVFGSLNKIEKSQRELPLHNQDFLINNQLASPSYATSLDFLKYRNVTAGAELNAFTIDFPNMKSTITLDIGAQYGHVPLIDSTRFINSAGGLTVTKDTVHLDANLFTLYPKLSLQIFPERRLGLTFSYQPQHTRFLSNNQFRQITSYAKSDLSGLAQEPASRWSHMFEALVKVEVNKESGSYAFFRSRFYWQQGDVNTFFPQLQIGYSYNLNIVKAINK